MTISQMVDFFDILQDKYGSPYFTTAEKERFLIQAEWDIIKDFLPIDGGEINVEKNSNTWMILNPLLFTYSHAMSGGNTISKATIESSISSGLGFTVKIVRPLAISWLIGNRTSAVKGPTRFNNLAVFLRNVFKVPTTEYPRYYETSSSYVILPSNSTTGTITMFGVRSPRAMSVAGGVTSELSEIFHNEVVARALELAGVASRDQLLSELKQLNKV